MKILEFNKRTKLFSFSLSSIFILALFSISFLSEAEAIPVFSFQFGSLGSGPGQFNEPFDVTTDSTDRMIVTDRVNNRIQIFNSAGVFQSQFGSSGTGPGQFNVPWNVATDSTGRIIVADRNNNRIQIFNSAGVFQSQFGSLGSGPGQFNAPIGVATDSTGRIIVADGNNNRIQIFNSAGVFQSQFGSLGSGPGQFTIPLGVATDSTDRIIVAEANNYRIQVFNSAGVFQSQFGSSGSGPGQFNGPTDVATDSTDRIIVMDRFNNRIQVFNSAGVFQFMFGSSGTGSGQFNQPFGVATDSTDRIIVADTGNNRIQVFIEDVTPPTVTTSVSDTLINDALGGTGSFSVISLFSESMDTGFTPAVSFTEDVSGTLSLNAGLSGWSTTIDTDDTYTSVYDVNVASQEETDVDATTSGGKDLAGNPQDADTTTSGNTFDVDTINPTVVSKTFSEPLISDADDPNTFDAVVTFSEAMDTAATPAITFSPLVPSTLTFTSGAWSVGDTVYTATYAIADGGVTEPSVTFTVSGAEDAADNAQVTDITVGSTFAIDTENPTAAIGYVDDDLFPTDLYAASGTDVTLTATISEPLAALPDITITGANTAGPSTMTFVSATSFTYLHIVGAGDGTATISLSSATDIAGNLIESAPSGADFFIDNTAPVGTLAIGRTDAGVETERTYVRSVNLVISCTDPAAPSTVPVLGSGCDLVDITGTGLDGEIATDFEAISSPIAATLTIYRDDKTATATYRDKAGNVAAPIDDTIALDPRITNVVMSDDGDVPADLDTPFWGVDATFTGTVENIADPLIEIDTITFDFGSPTALGIAISDLDTDGIGTFSVTDSYPQISLDVDDNPHEPSATLVDSGGYVLDSTLALVTTPGPIVTVQPHPTSVLLDFIPDPYTGDAFTAAGDLIDDLTLTGIAGKSVTFSGSGASTLLAATTSGFTVTDSPGVVINNPTSLDYILRLNAGATISFPSNPAYVLLSLHDMGTETVDVLVTPGVGTPFTATGQAQGINTGIFTLTHPGGISSITISSVSGSGPAGITRVETLTNDLIQIIDEEFDFLASGTDTSLSFSQGSFLSLGLAGPVAIDLVVDASFAGDDDYEPSATEPPNTNLQTYSVNYATAGGFGGPTGETPDLGTGIVSILCTNDADGDALCDEWEGTSGGIPMAGGGVYNLLGSDPARKDIYVEIDYMTGHDPFVSGSSNDAIDDVISAFAAAPVKNPTPTGSGPLGIVLHVDKGEELDHSPSTTVWTGFNSLKADNFGTPSESLAQKAAKAQAYHYFVFIHSVGGASGVAELKGNDGIVSLGVGFGEVNPSHTGTEGTRNEIAGTFLHELGHNLGLNHGGPAIVTNADHGVNCKPNHDSIMTYSRQMPNLLGANWKLDFSDGLLGPSTGLRESGGTTPTPGNIQESNGNLISLDNPVRPGTDPMPWIIWGTPEQAQSFKMQQARPSLSPASNIDWSGNGPIQSGTNLNMRINDFGFFGCETSTIRSTVPFKNYNEWTALNYNFRQTPSGQFDGHTGEDLATDQLHPNEYDFDINLQGRIISAIHQSVLPWSPESSLTWKSKGNVPIKVELFDGAGIPIVEGETTVTFKVFKSDGTLTEVTGTLDYEPDKIPPHWHADFAAQKKGTYFIQIILDNLGDAPDTVTQDPDKQYSIPIDPPPGPEGDLRMSMKYIQQK